MKNLAIYNRNLQPDELQLFYLTKVIVQSVKKSSPNLILRGLQNIVEKDIYRIKVELRSWRIVISLKFDDIFVSLQKFTLYDKPT